MLPDKQLNQWAFNNGGGGVCYVCTSNGKHLISDNDKA